MCTVRKNLEETMSTAAQGKVVSFHYTLTDDDGEVLDSSRGAEPLDYLHGHGGIVPGLEQAMAGRKVGEAFKVEVAAKDGYGEPEGPGPQKVPRKAFPDDVEIEVGMQFFAPGPGGQPIPIWVTDVLSDHVEIDMNHPLAGETLHFDVEIVEIRDASAEELSHGHPHGPDGHHHH
jgi:FKBP-type peptidyl-prolyl cis-trans isomerase SlyD